MRCGDSPVRQEICPPAIKILLRKQRRDMGCSAPSTAAGGRMCRSKAAEKHRFCAGCARRQPGGIKNHRIHANNIYKIHWIRAIIITYKSHIISRQARGALLLARVPAKAAEQQDHGGAAAADVRQTASRSALFHGHERLLRKPAQIPSAAAALTERTATRLTLRRAGYNPK